MEGQTMKKPAGALTGAVLIAVAAAVASATVAESSSKPDIAKEQMVDEQNQPTDSPAEGIYGEDPDVDDLEEPSLSGEPPKSAEDYVQQSEPDSQTVYSKVTLPESSVSGEGWAAQGP